MSTAYALSICSILSGFFPVIAAWYNYRYLDKTLKIAALYFLVSALSDLIQLLTQFIQVANNYPVAHLYILISTLLFGAIYFRAFFNPVFKKIIIALTAIVFLVEIINIFVGGIWEFPSLSDTVLSLMLICFSLAYFYQLLSRQEFIHIEKQGLFWINAGVLFYFSITIFFFMLFKRIAIAHKESYSIINYITNIFANVLYTVGLLCKPQKTT
ncbi:MAG TPA: hypothetical protein VIM16_19595 [Mucilaginibacter sp.]|jgi:hypothetical protein